MSLILEVTAAEGPYRKFIVSIKHSCELIGRLTDSGPSLICCCEGEVRVIGGGSVCSCCCRADNGLAVAALFGLPLR